MKLFPLISIISLIISNIVQFEYNKKIKRKAQALNSIPNINLRWNKIPSTRKKLLSTVGSTGPHGIHAYCDWVIGCRLVNWKRMDITNCWGNPNKLPKIIFISCGSFKLFFYKIFPFIPRHHRYIMIIGDEDSTIPNSKDDIRYNKNYTMSIHMWDAIVANPQIIHIFCTHLEIPATEKYSPIPVGFNPEEHPNNDIDHLLKIHVNLDIMKRPLKIIGCCRIRQGGQWKDRKKVRELCKKEWKGFADWNLIPENNFFDEIQNYSFLLCPHGGGIDPNPKAFSAIFVGTIPIMKKFINCELIYHNLPVVFIDEWTSISITEEKLQKWRSELNPYFMDGTKRSQVVEKLTTKYWFTKIHNKM